MRQCRCRSQVWFVVPFVLLVAGDGVFLRGAEVSLDDVLEIERQIVQGRKALRSGVVEFTTTFSRFSPDPAIEGHQAQYRVVFQDDNWRMDQSSDLGVDAQQVWTKKLFIRRNGNKDVQKFGEATRPDSPTAVPDPRLLGLVVWPIDTSRQKGFEHFFARTDRRNFRIDDHSDGATKVIRVRAEKPSRQGAVVSSEYWIAPEFGNSPVFMAVESDGGDGRQADSLNCEYQFDEASQIWFPKRTVYRSRVNDTVQIEYEVIVEKANFNATVDPAEFTLAGMSLPVGRIVVDDGKRMIWTGNSLVPKIHGEDVFYAEERSGTNWQRVALFANALFLVILVIAVAVHRYRSRPA